MPECLCSWLYHSKNGAPKRLASSIDPKRFGKSGRYFNVLNCASEYGLSVEVYGLEWVFVTPRSVSRKATGFEVMELPRSAWTVSWPGTMPCCVMACAMSCSATRADSRYWIVQPTAYRL